VTSEHIYIRYSAAIAHGLLTFCADLMDIHQDEVAIIAARVREFSHLQTPFRIYHGSTNSTRQSQFRRDAIIDTSRLSNVLKVDTDRNQQLAARYNVRGIPNFAVFSAGKLVRQQAGVVDHNVMEGWLKSAALAQSA